MPLNFAKTAMLLALLTAIFVAIGGLAGGQTGMVIAFVVALAMNGFSLWKSDKMVLSMHEAEEVNEQTAPEYYNLVRELAQRAELPKDKTILVYCNTSSFAGQVAMALRMDGFENVRLLHGGYNEWKASGGMNAQARAAKKS